jgi:hypothetical protein
MWNAGSSHHQIHLAIAEKGFHGSKAAVYQYICKLEYEDPCALTRKMNRNKPGTPWVDSFDKQEAQNLSELSLENIPRNAVYKSILKEGRSAREKDAQSRQGESGLVGKATKAPVAIKSKKPAMAKYSPLEQEFLDLMYCVDDELHENEARPGLIEEPSKKNGL